MANIYDLTGEFLTLWALIDEGTIDDDTLADVFANTTEELAIKLEGYCKFIKNVEAEIAGLKAEEKRLADKRTARENTIKRAKVAMQNALIASGENKIPCGTFTVSIQKNPPKVVIDDPYIENIPARYLIPQEPTIDKKAILADYKEGADLADLEGVAHIEQDESIRIR